MGGWFHGMTQGLPSKNVELRMRQFAVAGDRSASLSFAQEIVAGKIENQRTMLRCELTAADRERMITALDEVIHHGEDQVLMFDMGPVDGLKANQIAHLGQPYVASDHDALVV